MFCLFVVLVVTQLPSLGSQTSLSLQECLRLLEATFPFGEESEVKLKHSYQCKILLSAEKQRSKYIFFLLMCMTYLVSSPSRDPNRSFQ